ncbi:fatty acyl-CoA reductase 1-like [Diaphorina citri]|uniref:Fatty acyl-CoA reductase n=1 Tax=Diaphorina citri TaxID=121845 RepID=A0A1S4EAB1_DIACI|nr:fatty acyl-CoA reductase 1-like [Diaphorina citri]
MRESPIQAFYRNKQIFVTGATGFMGKVLVEKLLRSCYQLDQIYLLVREKKGKSTQERFEDIFSSIVSQFYVETKDQKVNVLEVRDNTRLSASMIAMASTDAEVEILASYTLTGPTRTWIKMRY